MNNLEEKIIDIIIENVPVPLSCPRCECPIEAPIFPDRWTEPDWLYMVGLIIDAVKEHIQLVLREEA